MSMHSSFAQKTEYCYVMLLGLSGRRSSLCSSWSSRMLREHCGLQMVLLSPTDRHLTPRCSRRPLTYNQDQIRLKVCFSLGPPPSFRSNHLNCSLSLISHALAHASKAWKCRHICKTLSPQSRPADSSLALFYFLSCLTPFSSHQQTPCSFQHCMLQTQTCNIRNCKQRLLVVTKPLSDCNLRPGSSR